MKQLQLNLRHVDALIFGAAKCVFLSQQRAALNKIMHIIFFVVTGLIGSSQKKLNQADNNVSFVFSSVQLALNEILWGVFGSFPQIFN